MIRILDGMPPGVLGAEAGGKLSAADYTEVLAPALADAAKNNGKLRVVLIFVEAFDGMEPGAVWQDLTMGIREWTAWERIALVTDHKWMRDGLRMFAWAIPGQAKAFESSEREAAIAWAAQPS